MLATYVINGGAGGDDWYLEAHAGQLFLDGQTIVNASITDVQVNGFGGEDLLVIGSASIPVVFNGGADNDWLSITSGLMTGTITSTITFNDSTGNDLVELRDEVWPGLASYTIHSPGGVNKVTLGNAGGEIRLGQAERLILNTGPAGSIINMNAAMPNNATTINGHGGPDSLFVNLQASAGNVLFNGNGGQDLIEVDDTGPNPNVSTTTYHLSGGLGTLPIVGYSIGGPFVRFDDATETMNFRGHGTLNRNYNIFSSGAAAFNITGGSGNDNFYFWPSETHGAIGGPVFVDAGAGNDTFLWPATNNVASIIAIVVQPVMLDGGSGFNSLSIDDTTRANTSYDIYPDRIRARDTLTTEWADFNYDNMGAVGITASSGNTTARIHGVSSDIPPGQQMTLLLEGGNDNATVFPRDVSGNLTINGNLGIGGGTGTDTVTIDDSASSLPIDYSFYNQFGPGTQNVGGLGSAGFGIGSNVENLIINAGSGDDTFAVNEYKSGTALTINAGAGNDLCDFGNGDLAANITSIASFLFNGQDGIDTFNLRNANATTSYTYTAASNTNIQTSRSLPSAYNLSFELWNTEHKAIHAGAAADTLNITSFASGELDFHGAGGDDTLNLPASSLLLGRRVNFFGGAGTANRINQAANAKASPSTVHVLHDSIGAFPGDDFFAPGGSIHFDSVQIIQLRTGTGPDTAFIQPNAVATLNIIGGSPSTSPGDVLNLALAAAENYLITGTPDNGSVTSDNLKPFTWSGFESGPFVDDVSPAVIEANININGIPAFADGSVRRQSLDVRFSEDVSALISPAWLELMNLTTNEPIPAANIAVEYDTVTNTAHYIFPGYANGVLPDGNYAGKVLAGLPDFFGNALPGDATFDFFFLSGDANHDGRVNLADFNILAANFGQGGGDIDYTKGDFNYDGVVNLMDFNILAGRFGTVLGSSAFSRGPTLIGATDARGSDDRLAELA